MNPETETIPEQLKIYTHKLTRVHKKQVAPPGYIFMIISLTHKFQNYTYKLPVKVTGLTLELEKEIADLAYNNAIKTLENGKSN